tara:strand:- start:1998 stop:2756 length:759 start_codon:yes stop_codon:yes gene_type:complete
MPKSLKVLKVRDKTDSYAESIDRLFDIPFRMLICAKSGHGKSNLLTNIILNEKFGYRNKFEAEDIHIIAPSIHNDEKLNIIIREKEIPDSNLHEDYSDEMLLDLYDDLVEDYKESISDKVQPVNKLLILDDLSFSGAFSKNRFNALSKVYCNGRKYLISVICLNQLYSHVTPTIRNNSSVIFLFNTNLAQLEQIEQDNNYLKTKKEFILMFRENIKEKHDFLCVNYSNNYKELYLNSKFEPIINSLNNNNET